MVGLVATARRRRLPRSKVDVVGLVTGTTGGGYDPTYKTFDVEGITYKLIGDDSASDTPIFDSLHKSFASTMPSPSFVRLDDPTSYSAFRSARRDPYVASLESRLSALEDSFDQHTSDDYGEHDDLYDSIDDVDSRLSSLEDAFHAPSSSTGSADAHDAAVRDVVDQTARGGVAIPLPPDLSSPAIESWQDGPEILCTVRFTGDDGSPLLATSGAPAEKSLSEAVRAADVLGLDVEELVCAAPVAAQVLGASSLVPHLCGAIPHVVACLGAQPGVAKVTPAMDPRVAAAMALVQRGQGGDGRAVAEVSKLNQRDPGLVEHALGCLTYARGGAE